MLQLDPVLSDITVRALTPADWPAVRDIYQAGLATGDAGFETVAPSWKHWDRAHLPDHRLVAELDSTVVGWAALSPVSDRCALAGVAENSVYVDRRFHGRGVGKLLLEAVVTGAEHAGFWTIQAGIFPENRASLALHQRCGFRRVGIRERIGKLNGVWRDSVLLEHRRVDDSP